MIDSQTQKTFFAIEYMNNYVGNISLSLGTDVYRKSAEIGYFIGEPFWNKGIATKAVNLITEWGFKQLDIVRNEYKSGKYLDELTVSVLLNYTIQQRYQIDKDTQSKFIDDAFKYLNDNNIDYKHSEYIKNRSFLKRLINFAKSSIVKTTNKESGVSLVKLPFR